MDGWMEPGRADGPAWAVWGGGETIRPARPGSVRFCRLTVTVFVCVAEDKERMETAGGPELHGPALVPALYSLLRRHGNQNPNTRTEPSGQDTQSTHCTHCTHCTAATPLPHPSLQMLYYSNTTVILQPVCTFL